MRARIESILRSFITENFAYGEEAETLSDDASLLDAGLIDSTAILELVAFLEKTFAIPVADEDIVPENLDSIARIAAYVRRNATAERPACREAIDHVG
jgi:acyl carrier protein